MGRRIVEIVEPCEHGSLRHHWPNGGTLDGCPGGSRRTLTEGEYVLIEKVDGEWPYFIWDLIAPRFADAVALSFDALAGAGE